MRIDKLCDRKLAKPVKYPWYEVEPQVGKAFMTYLASVLGKLPDLELVPITDQPSSAFFPFDTNNYAYFRRFQNLRGLILQNLLPIPAEPISLDEIAKFKQDHHKVLRRFRADIELLIAEIAAIEEPIRRDVILKAHMEKLAIQVEDIIDSMKSRNWKNIIFGTLFSIVGTLIPVTQLNSESGVLTSVGATTRLISTVYKAFGTSGTPHVINQPMAYAALAQTHFSKQMNLMDSAPKLGN